MNKKKQRILVLCLAILPVFCFSQIPKSFKSGFGIKGGLNLSTVNNNLESLEISPGFKPGFNIGGLLNLHFGRRSEESAAGTGFLGFQPEINFSQFGFAGDDKNISFNYLSVPLLMKIYPTSNISFSIGPDFMYMISASPSNALLNGTQIEFGNLKGSKDIGVLIGASYEMRTGLLIDVRYNLGTSAIANNLDMKNKLISLSVGWIF